MGDLMTQYYVYLIRHFHASRYTDGHGSRPVECSGSSQLYTSGAEGGETWRSCFAMVSIHVGFSIAAMTVLLSIICVFI